MPADFVNSDCSQLHTELVNTTVHVGLVPTFRQKRRISRSSTIAETERAISQSSRLCLCLKVHMGSETFCSQD